MIVSKFGAKTVTNPISDTRKVAGIVTGALENRTNIWDASDDDVDSIG